MLERPAALLDAEQHPAALERAAIASLNRGELDEAFHLADRRCRILPVAQARHYTLRAEIAHRSGFAAAALKDVGKALELAPDDLAANRRLMQWGDDEQRTAAARRLIDLDRDMTVIGEAVRHLQARGETALGAIHRVGDGITGWAAWQGRGQISLQIENDGGAVTHSVASDPQHVLTSKAEHAASFSVAFPTSTTRRVVSLRLGRRTVVQSVFPAPLAVRPDTHRAPKKKNLLPTRGPAAEITIIVPIYDDFEATRRCLECLMKAVADHDRIKLVLVDDATPDTRIAALLDSIASKPKVRLIRNAHNLGFIGAVNRALHATPSGDVILLNADTIVPKGFALRLSEAAHAAPDIGTVTPLSNNGEATSLPLAFTANPLPPVEEVAHLDAIAARANAGRLIDMPDGIGFCLYITRPCLEAVGGLSDHYHRGYLEDVDLCLRARQQGFRNVCAASVYVGHAGSASFKAEKRSLVVLNLIRLRLRFPAYRSESATFKALDPLKPSRSAIERELIGHRKRTTIVFSGPGAAADVAAQFAGRADELALLALFNQDGTTLALRDAGNDFPQSLDFTLPAEQSDLAEAIAAIAPSRVVLADPANMPTTCVRDLIGDGTTLDLLVTDGALLCRRGVLDQTGRLCAALLRGKTCDCGGNAIESWVDLLTRDGRILAPDMTAEAFLRRRLPSSLAKRVRRVTRSDGRSPMRPKTVASRGKTLGLLPVGHRAGDFAFLRDLVRCLGQQRPDARIVVLGETLDDLALMALGNVTVTGRVQAEELRDMAALHRLGGLLIVRRIPSFGHPLIMTAFSDVDVPLAFFDWTFGSVRPHGADLPMAPSNEAATTAEDLLGWMAGRW
ncbi:glycosyltransferase [Bradyrhizobium sp. CB82]|uniref:glycosyltransferase n=1 Tax=Bradyrhizobium sp. CB82 TaxID=3039159 RepID=UPI0024B26986|nr:glycosyltransferase [Bradyrhizobium sp. CB82]WFU39449.1 glycosyltransferase [Bradyrhizobium sp. CB82]